MANTNFDNSLNTKHISANLYSNYEAARSSFFVLEVALGKLLKPEYTGHPNDAKDTDYIEGSAEEKLKLNVTKAPVPHFSLGTEEIRRGNDVIKFATVPTWDSGSIEVDDFIGIRTKDILMAWQYLAYNPNTRLGGRMKDYKKVCTLKEYTQDYELIREWRMDGCFITKLTEGEFDRENDGRRKITADISYDRATVKNYYENI